MTTRHAWTKLETHHYRCTRCGMTKTNLILPGDPHAQARWETRFELAGVVSTDKTPPCPGSPPAALVWTRKDRYVEQAETGHRVCAVKVATPAADRPGWLFEAWTPDCAPDVKYYDWPPGDKDHYRRGESVPQRCMLLGGFDTADAARAACERDAAASAATTTIEDSA